MAQESQHWMSQGEVREEVDCSESMLRPCSLLFCVQNDTVLFSMKVRDLDYGA